MQPDPSFAGDMAGGASGEDTSKLENEGEAYASEIKEPEDLFKSRSKDSEDKGGDRGAGGKDNAPEDTANQQDRDIFVFPDEE